MLYDCVYDSENYDVIPYLGLTDDEKSYLRRIERKLDHDLKSKEYMKNLDPVFRKQNRALVDVSALRRLMKL